MIVGFSNAKGQFYRLLTGFNLSFFNKAFINQQSGYSWALAIFRKSKDLAISLQFHISSINKLFSSEYQDRL
jgi:hypothetical protein